MDYKKIIEESWGYTQNNKRLIFWLGVIPAFFTTSVGVGYIAYQIFALKKSYLFNTKDESLLEEVLGFIWKFISEHFSWTIPLAIAGIIFAIIYFLLPTLAKAGAIQTISRNKNGQKAGVGTGVRYGLMSYLPLLEYHLLIKTFGVFSILIEMSFVLRNLGPDMFKLILPVFLVMIVIGVLLTLLLTYSDFYIVIDGKGVFDSMKASIKLVILNWRHTFLVTILMLLIGVRIFVQAILVFLIPTLVVLISGYLAVLTLPITGIIVGGVVGLAALLIASYLNGVIDIFSYTVWTFTFLELTAEKQLSAREKVISPREVVEEGGQGGSF